jgi:micrococcal nuclease
VEKALDGDTLLAEVGGRMERVRLIGIDAPEHGPGKIEPLGPEATAFTRREAEGRMVYLEPGRERRDRYRRLLAYVWLSRSSTAPEDLLNYRLLARGLARLHLHPPNLDHALALWRAEREARKRGLGIWKASPAWR